MVRGCYSGAWPKFNATRSLAVLRGLDFFKVPQELRPPGLVFQAHLREKHHSLQQQARQLIEAAETDIISSMIPDDTGVATSKLYFYGDTSESLSLRAWAVIAPGQPDYDLSSDNYGAVELDPWFSNVIKHAAEGCGFKTVVKRVRSADWDGSFCTCLSLSLDIPGAKILSV